jgi:hypothetical protein
MDPLDVGYMVVDAIQRNWPVFTHNEHREGAAASKQSWRRFRAIRWIPSALPT